MLVGFTTDAVRGGVFIVRVGEYSSESKERIAGYMNVKILFSFAWSSNELTE